MGATFKPKLNQTYQVSGTIIERNEEYMKIKSMKLNSITTTDDYECTFNPKIKTDKRNDEYNLSIGERLFSYQDKYKQKKEYIKDQLEEKYSFKPEISKNTDNILKKRDLAMEEIKKKYNSSPKYNDEYIEEIQNEEQYDGYQPKEIINRSLKKYAQKVEKKLNE
jgi:hypothetical protein